MSYYDHNIGYIKKYHPYLHKEMDKNREPVLNDDIVVWSEYAKRKGEALFLNQQGKTMRLNSIYDPEAEASIWADQYEFKDMNMYCIMFGFGNGSFARELIKKMRKDTFFIILEPSISIFMHVMEHYDIADILKTKNMVIIIEGINDADLHNSVLAVIDSFNLRTGIQVLYPTYDTIFPYSYLNFLEQVKYGQNEVVYNIATEINIGVNMLTGILSNLKKMVKGTCINDLKSVFPENMPVILVAAGPSIKKNIHELKKAKGKALIIAVDRILEYLLENDVRPDLVAMIDPSKPPEMLSTKGKIDIPFLSALEANPEIIKLSSGKQIFTVASRYPAKLYFDMGYADPHVTTGISVATMVASICIRWGIKNIILVGQDLSYNEEHETHASNIKENYVKSEEYIVDGYYGGKVESRLDWIRMLTWYEDLLFDEKDLNMIDATQGGALIKGTVIMDLKDAVDKYGTQYTNYEKLINDAKPSLDHLGREKLLVHLEHDYDDLSKIRRKAKSGIAICKKFMDGVIPEEKEIENLKKMQEINQFISVTRINSLIDMGVNSIAEAKLLELYRFSDNEKENKQQTFEQAKIIYEATCESVDFVRKYLKKSIKDVKTEIEEVEKELMQI